MEDATVESLLDKIKPPRLEDAGLEDCALPPESIKEAFLKAASAVRSFVSQSDDEDCVHDPWEPDSSDALVGIQEGAYAPSQGCTVEKGTEASVDKVSVAGGDVAVDGGRPCVEGLQGLEIGEKSKGILGITDEDHVAQGGDEEKPTLAPGYA